LTYLITYLSYSKVQLAAYPIALQKLARHLVIYPKMLVVLALQSLEFKKNKSTIINRYKNVLHELYRP